MCGRVNVSDHEGLRALMEMMGMQVWPIEAPRFNIAPSMTIDVITMADDDTHGLALMSMHWGFTNRHRHSNKQYLINARSETVFQRPSFRTSALNTRAIVLVNGFYEWQTSVNGKKQAFHIAHANAPAMALAAIFQPSAEPREKPVEIAFDNIDQTQQLSLGFLDDESDARNANDASDARVSATRQPMTEIRHRPDHDVCLLTLSANSQMSAVHHRMPLLLDVEQAQRWLREGCESLLHAYCEASANTPLKITRVDGFVNSIANDGPKCLASTGVSNKRH